MDTINARIHQLRVRCKNNIERRKTDGKRSQLPVVQANPPQTSKLYSQSNLLSAAVPSQQNKSNVISNSTSTVGCPRE